MCCGGGSCSSQGFPVIGQPIQNFEADAYHENSFRKIHLSDFKGKWVIFFFYPADFTFICPTELEEMAAHYDQFQKLDTEVLSISTDTKFTHKAWHDHSPAIKNIHFPMVADPAGDITKSFGVYIEEGDDRGLALRGTFLVDPDGILQAYEIHNNNIGRSAGEILRKLEAAIFVRKHGGEVCPANWKPGAKTLTPSIDLVGKI
ncbi:MAG: peroxiredoxin [Candidatus Moranbacteria bacterium]|nr:peroxiredoxin [Candidatus Moranbacteria bacterium]